MTTTTTFTRDQVDAAYHLQETCHELTGILADEPAGGADYERRWQEWHDLYGKAYRVHEDAEHDYRHAFGHAPNLPEAHDVIAAATTSVVELLRGHVIETVTQIPMPGEDTNTVVIDCLCGGEIRGVMPDHIDSTSGSLQWLMSDHIAAMVLRHR